jgi:branched-chain amino acid transport system substrate-binding protein
MLVLAAGLAPQVAGAAETRIGFANPLSGPYASSGGRNQIAVELAVEAINAAGGVLGHQLTLVRADDACDAERAAGAAQALVEAGVAVVVGHMCSHASLVAAAVYEAAGVVMITPDSTHPRLTEEGRRNVFRLTGRDDRQGMLAGDFLAGQRQGRRIGIVHDGSTYGQGLAEQTRRRLHERGVEESVFEAYVPGEPDQSALVDRLRQAGVGLLYVGGYGPDAARIVRAARQQGSTLQLVGGDGLGMDEFAPIAGAAGEGAIFSTRRDVARSPEAAVVLAQFRARGLGSLPSGIGAYAAVQVWAQAAERAGTLAPAAVDRALRYGRFATVLGWVAFDDKGDLEGADWQWQIWHAGSYGPLQASVAMR